MVELAGIETREQMIEKNARWRLSGALNAKMKIAADIASTENLSHVSLAGVDTYRNALLPFGKSEIELRFDHASSKFVAERSNSAMANRWASFANSVASYPRKGMFVANVADAQPWRYRVRDELLPVFQFSRRPVQREVILWPHDDWYMGPGSPNLPVENTDRMSFEEKRPQAVWRGVLSGTYVCDQRIVWAESVKRELIERGLALSSYNLFNSLCHFPRYRLVHRYGAATEVNVGLVHEDHNQHHKALIRGNAALEPWQRLYKEPLSREVQLEYRYILCPEGNDYSSGLFWALRSNSVVMMPVPRWHTILHFGLRPWEHYIPVKRDFSDVVEKINFANQNVLKTKQIAVKAFDHTSVQADGAFRADVDRRVLSIYSDAFL